MANKAPVKTADKIENRVKDIVRAYTAYKTAARKALPEAVVAGTELRQCKKWCKEEGIVWGVWCDKQRKEDPNFPVRYWCDKLITLAEGWEKIKNVSGITSVEQAVNLIKNRGTEEGTPIKHKGTGLRAKKIKREVLLSTLTGRHLGISPDDFRELLLQLGVKIELVD